MKKIELIAKLEGAKELTSVVSIDLVLTALGMLEPEVREVKVVGINEESFEKIMGTVSDALRNLRNDRAIDFESAQFAINYNNQVELEDAEVDTDYIENCIRESLEELVEEDEDEDEDDLPQQILSGDEEAQAE